jgi:hypothetical protein
MVFNIGITNVMVRIIVHPIKTMIRLSLIITGSDF